MEIYTYDKGNQKHKNVTEISTVDLYFRQVISRKGIEVTFTDLTIPDNIDKVINRNTKVSKYLL